MFLANTVALPSQWMHMAGLLSLQGFLNDSTSPRAYTFSDCKSLICAFASALLALYAPNAAAATTANPKITFFILA